MSDVILPEAHPRDREVQEAVLRLVEAYAFDEAHAILGARLRELSEVRRSHAERLFLEWRALDPGARPDFLTCAHHRRHPELGRSPS